MESAPSMFFTLISWKRNSAPQDFMTFFFEVLRNFGRYIRENWAYGSKVTQHYVIERLLKIWTISGFVYKTWKMASCAKNPFWALKCNICSLQLKSLFYLLIFNTPTIPYKKTVKYISRKNKEIYKKFTKQ